MQNALKKRPLVIGIIASLACASTIASESEQFSLLGQPDILFDGANGDTGVITGVHNGIPYEVIHGFAIAQGDIVLGRVLPNGQLDVGLTPRGLGQSSLFERWTDGIIPYQFSDGVSQTQRDRAQIAIAHWNANTKIKLVSRTNENAEAYSDFINFELGGGCASYVGKKGGSQTVWLADNCTVGSIIHEVGHAIGLFHEHTRPDRDSFVTVNLNNISSGKQLNFDTIVAGAENFSDYDYGSIMHYGEYFFSSNGEPTITVPDGIAIGQREALSTRDIDSINNMYATDLQLALSTTANEESTQVDVVVSNIGELGASDLTLTASWGENSDWLSISNNSGWDCEKFGAELRCSKSTLSDSDESLFSILVDAKDQSVDALQVRVQSRTLDTQLNNNAFNDTATQTVQSGQQSSTPTSDVLDEDPSLTTTDSPTVDTNNGDAANNEPDLAAAEPTPVDSTDTVKDTSTVEQTNTVTTTDTSSEPEASESSSGGGGAPLYLLALLFLARVKRRR